MTSENRARLESLRHVLINRGGDAPDVDEVLRIVREEWDANYRVDMWCGHCKMQLIEYAFGRMDSEKVDTVHIDLPDINLLT